ncbi:MAG: hypothetical protein JJT94_14515 [Bernardetiaceae bacterium]|nr:hypothetical protein [Bernardetiaceae bacterium]
MSELEFLRIQRFAGFSSAVFEVCDCQRGGGEWDAFFGIQRFAGLKQSSKSQNLENLDSDKERAFVPLGTIY